MSAMTFDSLPFPGEIVFVQRMLIRGEIELGRWGSHLNYFRNLHDLSIEFSACLEWRLLEPQPTVTLSNLASQTYAGVQPINLSRT